MLLSPPKNRCEKPCLQQENSDATTVGYNKHVALLGNRLAGEVDGKTIGCDDTGLFSRGEIFIPPVPSKKAGPAYSTEDIPKIVHHGNFGYHLKNCNKRNVQFQCDNRQNKIKCNGTLSFAADATTNNPTEGRPHKHNCCLKNGKLKDHPNYVYEGRTEDSIVHEVHSRYPLMSQLRGKNWSGNTLSIILRWSVHLLIDATFHCVPSMFYQCLILMAHDDRTDAYIPIAYVLMTHKFETLYDEVMHRIVILSEYKIKCLTYTTDFEHDAIMNSCEHQFGSKSTHNGQHIGCYFHWKQAIVKYLTEKCGLTWESKTLCEVMSETPPWGGLEILTQIPVDEIISIGIPYCKLYLELDMKELEKPMGKVLDIL